MRRPADCSSYYSDGVRYLAQFPAGTSPLVEVALTSAFDQVNILHSDDSAMVFESVSRIGSGKAAPFAKNVFYIRA